MLLAATIAAFGLTSSVFAHDGWKALPVHDGLDNPSGVAVNPETGHVYVATHRGVLHREPHDKDGSELHTEIGGYSTDVYGKGPKYNIGPLGVAFLNASHLIVGDGSRPDGEELVRVYRIESGDHKEQKEEDAVYTLGPIKPGEQTVKGEGNFYGVAVGAGSIYVTCNGDDTKGWVSRAKANGRPGALEPFIATKEAVEVDAPVAITFTPDGKTLVVGQMGEMNVPGDSLLTFYDPNTGELKKKLETGLSDIAGLAYSPKTGTLYAVDYSWSEPDKGGLFKLDPESGKATKIVALDKPTALAFDKRGRLYITQFGTAKEGSSKPPGSLLRIKAGL